MRFSTAWRNRDTSQRSLSMVIVISQSVNACHMDSGDVVSCSIGELMCTDSYLIHSTFVAFSFSYQVLSCFVYLILCCPVRVLCLLPCGNLLYFRHDCTYDGFFTFTAWTLHRIMSGLLAYKAMYARFSSLHSWRYICIRRCSLLLLLLLHSSGIPRWLSLVPV